MEVFIVYLMLFCIIVLLGQLFQQSSIPIVLILVIVGILMSFLPFMPEVTLEPNLILNIFLPLLIYQIASFSSWHDVKKQFRPIALLSVGHVIFITLLVALVVHTMIPTIGWPLAFVVGAIISPPDDVAIVAITEKIKIPERVFIILEGEGMFNDVAALTLFRFALAAAITNSFSLAHAFSQFFLIIIGEIVYGIFLGNLLGKLRSTIKNTKLHVIASFITPFLAYIPVVALGGTGVLATATTGFIIGNRYTLRFTPEYRLTALIIWPSIAFAIEGLIFILVGLDMRSTLMRMSAIPLSSLMLYVIAITLVIIVGRFIWVYGAMIFTPRLLFPSLRKKDPYPPWQYPFIISWAGIRGGISLAAALAIPAFLMSVDNVDARDLIVFFIVCMIIITLILQGLTLPFLLKKIGVDKVGQRERYNEHITELKTRKEMTEAALNWLHEYKINVSNNEKLLEKVMYYIQKYQALSDELDARILAHRDKSFHDEEKELFEMSCLLIQIIDVEKEALATLWREEKINLRVRNKLITSLDHQLQRHIS